MNTMWRGRRVLGSAPRADTRFPNGFHGLVRIFRARRTEWAEEPEADGYRDAARGYGVADMARALVDGRQHRAHGELAYHVLDVMESLLAAADAGAEAEVGST